MAVIISLIAYNLWIFSLCLGIILIFIYCFKLEKKLNLNIDFTKKFSNILIILFFFAIPWVNILVFLMLFICVIPSLFNEFLFKLKKIRG